MHEYLAIAQQKLNLHAELAPDFEIDGVILPFEERLSLANSSSVHSKTLHKIKVCFARISHKLCVACRRRHRYYQTFIRLRF
ncbi:hypothetical protein [Nostoc sp.]